MIRVMRIQTFAELYEDKKHHYDDITDIELDLVDNCYEAWITVMNDIVELQKF